jgi:putative transposase
MTRIARIVVPGLPHHVTQRGNRGERIFFEDGDYALYRDWLAESCRRFGVSCWAYCLMPNHVHLILTPQDSAGLALALSRAHRLYAGYVNARARQTGHLFQGRFGSVAMDEEHLMIAARYVALNPVRARLAARARDWPHSSVRAHLARRDDGLVSVKPLLERAPRFADLLDGDPDEAFTAFRRNELIGRRSAAPSSWRPLPSNSDATSRFANVAASRTRTNLISPSKKQRGACHRNS